MYARQLTRPGDIGYIHGSFHLRKELYYYLDRDIAFSPSLVSVKSLATAAQQRAFVLCSPKAMAPSEHAIFDELALTHPVHQVDDFAVLDLRNSTPVARSSRPVARRYDARLSVAISRDRTLVRVGELTDENRRAHYILIRNIGSSTEPRIGSTFAGSDEVFGLSCPCFRCCLRASHASLAGSFTGDGIIPYDSTNSGRAPLPPRTIRRPTPHSIEMTQR